MSDHFDLLIIGAGLSGIGAAYHIQDKCPGKRYAILEGRAAMGGTWDLFRYPGIRSDSDMYTLGFSFYPWKNPQAIADGPAILSYIKETAAHFGIDEHIRYEHRVTAADWSSADRRWTLTVARSAEGFDPDGSFGAEPLTLTCDFLFPCSGYYDYRAGHNPALPGEETFRGPLFHPQHWPEGLDYRDREVVVIGSGATAVTLVPELAKTARRVTMLQRSPTYIMNLPRRDVVANFLKKVLPARWAHTLARWKNILISMGFYQVSRRWPGAIKRFIKGLVRKEMGDQYEDRHFDPDYDPWDQRLCLVPDNDLFVALKSDRARIVTDHIERITPTGIETRSGAFLPADIIVKATGLKVQLFGGMVLRLDGEPVDTAATHAYKGVMLSGVPNFAIAVGYTNASWTLKCDLNGLFVTKVLNYMDQEGYEVVTPRFDPDTFTTEPLLDFDAGYVRRALHILPKQGSAAPWKVYQNYVKDLFALKYGSARDRYLEYR